MGTINGCGIPCYDGIQWAKTLLCWGCVILKFSEDEFLSLLAELKVKSKFLIKVIKIKCLKQ